MKFGKITLFFIFLLVIPLQAAQKMAVITKVRGEVQIRPAEEKKFNKNGAIGTILSVGDEIKTGKDGYVVVVFLDDKSQIKLLENCTMLVQGEKSAAGLDKELAMSHGKLKAEISKQRRGEFKIATPTSVASVKGTDFWVISDASTGDQIIGLSGLVELLNLISGDVTTVGANQTGISYVDGDVDVNPTNPEDIPADDSGAEGDNPSQLRIEVQDASGNTKEIIIDYR
jgi:predicted secreted protein